MYGFDHPPDYTKISSYKGNGTLMNINNLILQINAVSETLLDHSNLFKVSTMEPEKIDRINGTLQNIYNALKDVDRALGN